MKPSILFLTAVLLLAGCITRPQITREEYIDMTTRNYEGVTNEQIFQAAENFFILLDGDDFDITYPNENMLAVRNWLLGLHSGNSRWAINTTMSRNSVKVRLDVKTTLFFFTSTLQKRHDRLASKSSAPP